VRQLWISLLTAAVGLVLIVTSLNWSRSYSLVPAPRWSEQQAHEYARASTEYHYHRYHQQVPADSRSADQMRPLEAAKQRYLEQRAQLEAARSRPRIWATTLRWCGIGLAAGGLVGFFLVRRD
jgi:hypothetical protein